MYIWISKRVLQWATSLEGSKIIEYNIWHRAHEIWGRSKELIENAEDKFDLTDGIANLKRCLNQRLKLIEKLYRLKTIDFENKPKGYLELLECYGIIRPLILKNLLFIRNEMEHNDSDPPSINSCKEFLDVMWYFLKSTDSIVQFKKETILFSCDSDFEEDTQYWMETQINPLNYSILKTHGWFPKKHISEIEKIDYFKVEVVDIGNGESNNYIEKTNFTVWINGNAILSNNDSYIVIKQIFTAY